MWMLPVWTANQHGAGLKVTASSLRFAAEEIKHFEDLFNENEGVFSYDKNPHLPQNYKKQCFLFFFVCMFYDNQFSDHATFQ